MNKALIIIKSPGIGDLQILLSNIHHISKEIGKPVTVLAQNNTGAKSVFKYDPHVDEVIDTIPEEDSEKSENESEPLQILKIRFAKGEITKEEFIEMKRMLE